MRFIKIGLAAVLVIGPMVSADTITQLAQASDIRVEDGSTVEAVSGKLVLKMNSVIAQMDGKSYSSTRPTIVKNGVSYVGLRFIADRLGATISHDSNTNEMIVRSSGVELRYKSGSKIIKVDGKSSTMKGSVYADRNVMMIPVTSLHQGLSIPYTVDGKTIILQLGNKPVASFFVLQKEIFAGETQVIYHTKSYSPRGLSIVDERWEGRQELFDEPGSYVISYSVQDSKGVWSDPYKLTIQINKPNEAPKALFTTDKAEYRIGEPVTFTDLSTDEEEAIVDQIWTNNSPAFFTPGTATVTLSVTDKHGASSEFSKDIVITTETMYTKEQFELLFTPLGKNMDIDGYEVKAMEALPYTYSTEPYTLFRSSGPESVYEEGILYQDDIEGAARLLLHHVNRTGKKAKLYVIAQNRGLTPASLQVTGEGAAGPTPFPELSGKLSLARYLENSAAGNSRTKITLAPGESILLFNSPHLAKPMPLDDVVTFIGDLTSDSTIRYTSVLIGENRDPIAALPNLTELDPVESIVRGTFADSNRVFEYDESIGERTVKLSLTDNAADPFQTGWDGLKGTAAINSGNYAVLYKLKLQRVAPHTVIAFNPRGGSYSGAALVNGVVVTFAHSGAGYPTNEASVLHRTGDSEEAVEIWISPAAGSNMPFTLLFKPMPEVKV